MSWNPEILESLLQGQNLSMSETKASFDAIMEGQWSDPQIAAFLTALRAKGETIEELAAAAKSLRAVAVPVNGAQDAVDVCGTGGDGLHTINISTAAGFVVRGAGAKVAKHGNRSVSSQCGSADVLEELGGKIDLSPEQTQSVFDKTGFCFMFAPNHHPAMRHVVPVRKALGVRTMFNLLGPLLNPASVKTQLLGVYSKELVEPMAYVLKFLGVERAVVIHSEPGMDEASCIGQNWVAILEDGEIMHHSLDATQYGFDHGNLEDIAGGDKVQNALAIKQILAVEEHTATDAVLFNAGIALFAAGHNKSIETGIEAARQSITSGQAANALQSWIDASNAA